MRADPAAGFGALSPAGSSRREGACPVEVVLLFAALVIIACILFNKLSDRIGVPALLAFILLGMVCGVDGIFHIDFDNFPAAENAATVALIFIMFYGGFGTNW